MYMKQDFFNIALVVKTDGLEYDDRIRKEILSAQRLAKVKFKIFVMLKDNVELDGLTSYGVPYHSVYIPAREKYSSASHTLLKSWQFYKVIKKEVEKFDAVWCADIGTELTAMFLKNKRMLFDCHEIPTHLIGSRIGRILCKLLFKKCRIILHANPQRIDYLESIGMIQNKTKHVALRNYPDNSTDIIIESNIWSEFEEWVVNRKCVYLQGLVENSRASYESVAAILGTPGLSAVVIGKYDSASLEKLKVEFGKELDDRVFFTGKIPQESIIQYVRKCFFSMIFYKNIRPNNWYCEANRFYLAASSGLPVITGNNPPMRSVVEKYHLGISIDDDGGCLKTIKDAITVLLANYDQYSESAKKASSEFSWVTQDDLIKEIVEDLLK